MKPETLVTKIFLDSGDPKETKEIMGMTGCLDGQTTNPSLIAGSPEAKARLERGEKFSEEEVYEYYKKVIQEISGLIPDGSVSIEVYGDSETTAEAMFAQGKEMFGWIPNAHIKYPTTAAGLEAAERSIAEGMRVNMTLVFSQEQAAAVHAATKGAKKGDVFVSPFIGRLDDIGINGMDLIENIIRMYKEVDSHVEVLAASARSYEHFLASLAAGVDFITCPFKYNLIQEWVKDGMRVPGDEFGYGGGDLKPIVYKDLDLSADWRSFDIQHELTDKGLAKFAEDWNGLIG